ncbi:MAG TPA: DUF2568 domain-containing protein [Gaiellales bacterium]|jgi:hypothetical protein
MRAANLALRFLLELAALAGLADWGLHTGGGPVRIVLALAAVGAAAVVWGMWCAPKSSRRLPQPGRTVVEAVVFGLGAAGFAAAGHASAAVVFAVLAVVNWVLLFAWGQDP